MKLTKNVFVILELDEVEASALRDVLGQHSRESVEKLLKGKDTKAHFTAVAEAYHHLHDALGVK